MTRLLCLPLCLLLSACYFETRPLPPPPPTPSTAAPFFTVSVDAWGERQGPLVVQAGTTGRLPLRVARFNQHTAPIRLEVRADPSVEISTPDPAVTLEYPTIIEPQTDLVELVITAAPGARGEYHQVLIDAESDQWSSGAGLQLNLDIIAARPASVDGGGVSTLDGWAALSAAPAFAGSTNHMAFSVMPASSDLPIIRLVPEARRRTVDGAEGEYPGTEVKQFLPHTRVFDLVSDAFTTPLNGSDRVTAPASVFSSDGRFYVLRARANQALKLRLDRSEFGETELSNVAELGPSASGTSMLSDTSIAAGPNGEVYFAWRETRNEGPAYFACTATPSDGGVSLSAVRPIVVPVGTRFDRAIAVGGPSLRVVTMERVNTNQSRLALSRALEGAGALTEDIIIDDSFSVGGDRSLSAVGLSSGEVYVSYRALVPSGQTLVDQLRVKRVAGGVVTDLSPEVALLGSSVASTTITATEAGVVFVGSAGGYMGFAAVARYEAGAWRVLSAGDASPVWVSQLVLQRATFGAREVLFRALRIDNFYSNEDSVVVQTWNLR